MKSIKIIFYLFISSLIFVFGCGKMAKETEEHDDHEQGLTDDHDHADNLAIITAEQFKAIDIVLGDLEQKNLTGILKSSGYLKVPPQNKADVTALYGGIIQQIYVKEGDYVHKGKLLVTVINKDFIEMQENYLTTKSELLFAEQDLNRQQLLNENNVSAQKNLQQAQAKYTSLHARLRSLQQQLALAGIDALKLDPANLTSVISIGSPVDGFISHIDVNIGSSVESAKTIMDVVDNSQLHLDLFIFEQDLMKIKTDQKINFSLTNLPGKIYNATIFAIGSAFENESKSIPIHAVITGDKTGLIEGMNVSANIEIKNGTKSAIPTNAIVSEAGRDFIFIWALDHQNEINANAKLESHDHTKSDAHEMLPGDKYVFEKMPVKRGISEDGYTEITPLGDYHPGEKIVINGAFYLLGSLSNEGEEHEH